MNKVLQDSSASKFVTAIEGNLSSWMPVFSKLGQVYVDNPTGVRRSITDFPVSLFNSVMDTQLAPDQTDAAIQLIISDAKARKVPVLWWIVPSTRPIGLGNHLKEYGFSLDDNDPGMAVDLEKLNEELPKPDRFSIRLAQDDAAWKQWSITMQAGFEISCTDIRTNAWWNMLCQTDPKTVLAYTGMLDDKPVATSLLRLAADAAGIYCVATIPEARRQGIGAWMTLFPLLQARASGYKIGVLFASEMGLGIYRSLGFQEYCKIASYRWVPE